MSGADELETAFGKLLEQLAVLFEGRALNQRGLAHNMRQRGWHDHALQAAVRASAYEDCAGEMREVVFQWRDGE